MDWTVYPLITYLTTALLAGGMLLTALKKQPLLRNILLIAGVLAMSVFTAGLWIESGRPPMRSVSRNPLMVFCVFGLHGIDPVLPLENALDALLQHGHDVAFFVYQPR
ncbi:MAG: hypothetical protein U5L09_16785 [Bacteroidales bacterium]|nr:hypothetical protein [Bacteroidales bacterium]